jgi:hypothetical protein
MRARGVCEAGYGGCGCGSGCGCVVCSHPFPLLLCTQKKSLKFEFLIFLKKIMAGEMDTIRESSGADSFNFYLKCIRQVPEQVEAAPQNKLLRAD